MRAIFWREGFPAAVRFDFDTIGLPGLSDDDDFLLMKSPVRADSCISLLPCMSHSEPTGGQDEMIRFPNKRAVLVRRCHHRFMEDRS